MRRLLRLSIYLAGAIALVAAAVVIVVLMLPRERIAALVSSQVEAATGRTLVIEGDIAPSVWPVLGVETGPIRLGNAPWGEAPHLVSAAGAGIGVELMPLLSGEIRVRTLRLVEPVIALEVAADGRTNWTLDTAAGATTGPAGGDTRPDRTLPAIALPVAEIVGGTLSYRDARDGREIRVGELDLTAGLDGLDQPLALTAEGLWQGRRVRIEGTLATPEALMAGREIALDAQVTADFGSAAFDGTLSDLDAALPRISGNYGLDLNDPKGALALLGRPADPALGPLGAIALKGEARIDGKAGGATADGSLQWRDRRVDLALGFTTEDVAAATPAGSLRLSAASPGLAEVSYEGAVTLGGALPALDGALRAKVPGPSAAYAWATGGPAPADLGQIGAASADTRLRLSDAGIALDGAGSAEFRGRAILLDFRATGGADWQAGGALATMLVARAPDMLEARLEGPLRLGAEPAFAGPVSASTPDLRGLIAWATGEAPAAPAGTLGAASLDARIDLAGDRIAARDLGIRLDGTEATGSASADLGRARPMVTAALTAGDLDLTPFTADGPQGAGRGAGGGGASRAGGWSSEPIDLAPLSALDADVTVDARSIRSGALSFGRSQLHAVLNEGLLDLTIKRLDAYGGGLSGTMSFGGREVARLSSDIAIEAVQLRPLLSALGVTDDLEGVGALRLRVDGRGRSMAELMRSLGGNGALELADGAILGINLAAMVRNLTGAGGGGRTDFTSVSGTFDIADGVLRNTDFSFLGPLIRVAGGGSVDLGAQRQDFTLTPRAVASLTGQGGVLDQAGLSIFPIRITGTWADPRIAPDLGAAIGRIMTDPAGTAEGLQQVITGIQSGDAPGAILDALTGGAAAGDAGTSAPRDPARGAVDTLLGAVTGRPSATESAGSTATGDGTSSPAPAPQGVGGLIGGLLGSVAGPLGTRAPAPSADAPAPAPAAPDTGAAVPQTDAGTQPGTLTGALDPEALPPEAGAPDPQATPDPAAPGALAPQRSRLPAPRRTAALPEPEAAPGPEAQRPEAEGAAAPKPDAGQRPRKQDRRKAPDSDAAPVAPPAPAATGPGTATTEPPASEPAAAEPTVSEPAPAEPAPAEPAPRRATPEEEAVRALGNILRGFDKK